MKRTLLLFFSLCFLSCAGQQTSEVDDHQHDHSEDTIALTVWTDQLELFMEYDQLHAHEPAHFIIHLTDLSDFQPLREGRIQLEFTSHGGKPITVSEDHPVKDGIFESEVVLPDEDHFHLTLIVHAGRISEYFDLGMVYLHSEDGTASEGNVHTEDEHADHDHASEDAHGHDHGTEDDVFEEVRFLKEQQWKTDFATELSRREETRETIPAVAEVIPQQQRFSEVVAPVDAFIDARLNRDMVVPGSHVKQGDELLTLSPASGSSDTWTERQLRFQQAEKDYRRAESLLDRKAISQREYERYRQTYLVEKGAFESILNAYGAEPVFDESNTQVHMVLRAPISGIISELTVTQGTMVSPGEKLLTIIDPSVVWIRADVYEKDYYRIEENSGLEITIPGTRSPMCLEGEGIKLINRGELMDPHNRTIPILFEVCNAANSLKIGQILQVNLLTSNTTMSVVVPQDAVLDEIDQQSVFVQLEGELFEKRPVVPRGTYKNMAILSEGLDAGERIVSSGVYLLKLASMETGNIGHGHIH